MASKMQMTITDMDQVANQKSSFSATVSFSWADGSDAVPDTICWSLVDRNNKVINGRNQVEVAEPKSNQRVFIYGDDLQIFHSGREYEKRWLVVEATYTSDLGNGLPLKAQQEFAVKNLKWIK